MISRHKSLFPPLSRPVTFQALDPASVIARLKAFEGCIDYMYKCTGGDVTIGIGHALQTAADAARLSWQRDGASADPEQVQSDYAAVAAARKGQVAPAYARLTRCRMGADDLERLVAADLQSFEKQLAAALPNWSSYPDPARQALFDMAFNLGIGGLKKFPALLHAANSGDWAAAATRCHRMGIGEARNQATVALFLKAQVLQTGTVA
jgi:GH24 family phage-related lysozyme (muramidase)